MIKLNRPLCVFDLETTGINVIHDRIVEICVIKVNIDNSEITKVWRINPTIPIPSKTTEIHGITDSMVRDCPTFKDVAKEISLFINKGHQLLLR